ncbi:methyl-accepting chemotaxis protein [Clostridium sp. PL3]|uniref:Methyl-accepting chemotaxis protein n=1 Tax=Clostridium thailandense TaxID=2794346 RepID=A0A949TUN8_9CLOT|nr:methyl-accepting chemotaxis protein [Clostridium thailandense]MBV7273806.1 methyl-accepting chemotaxis protein [Clostridium thailandense]
MKLKIRHKLEIAFSLILITLFANIIVSINIINHNKNSIKDVRENAYKQVEYAVNINEAVIQVQQFLSDASATKNEESFTDAEKYKAEFKDSITKLEQINPETKDNIEKINSDFDKFYELGTNMANVYIKDGYEKGNVLMEQFDPMATNLSIEINKLSDNSKKLMDTDLKDITNEMNISLIVSLILGGISLIVAIFIVLKLSKAITNPINSMLFILKDLEMGEGDLTERINIESRDEIGTMANSFNNFMDKLSGMVENIKDNSVFVSESSEALNESVAKIEIGAIEINNSIKNVKSDIENITNSVEEVTSTMDSIAQVSYVTAEGAQEIVSMSEQINDIAIQSEQMALRAKEEMKKTQKLSIDTMDLNKKLGMKAEEIEKIVDTIKQITDQTNLLALNASIEAARAGEYGRGFSVVAEEIRILADNNISSTKMISELVSSIQSIILNTISSTIESGENIKQGTAIVEDVHEQLRKIVDRINNINSRIENMASAAEEQSASTEELASTMESINDSNSKMALEVSSIVENVNVQTEIILKTNKMSSKLNNLSENLNNLVNKFKIS